MEMAPFASEDFFGGQIGVPMVHTGKAEFSSFPGGGSLHIKGVEVLVISLRGVNFWSHLECSENNASPMTP